MPLTTWHQIYLSSTILRHTKEVTTSHLVMDNQCLFLILVWYLYLPFNVLICYWKMCFMFLTSLNLYYIFPDLLKAIIILLNFIHLPFLSSICRPRKPYCKARVKPDCMSSPPLCLILFSLRVTPLKHGMPVLDIPTFKRFPASSVMISKMIAAL